MGIGPPILFENMLIRKMLELAEVTQDDVFYDLGCGYAQNLIIAASEYGVRDCIGVEDSKTRVREAWKRIEQAGLEQRITIVNENLEHVDLYDATVVFYGLSPSNSLTEKFMRNLQSRCRFIYYINAPQPAIMPNTNNYPFYRADAPLSEETSEEKWLSAHIRGSLSIDEYWDEMIGLDPVVRQRGFFGSQDLYYRGVLKRLLRRRLSREGP